MSESLNYFQELEMYKKLFGLLLTNIGPVCKTKTLWSKHRSMGNQRQYILLWCTDAKSEATCEKQSWIYTKYYFKEKRESSINTR